MPSKDPNNPDLFIGDDGLARPEWAYASALALSYYDNIWGMHMRREEGMFQQLMFEIYQREFSLAEVLAKRQGMRAGFGDFVPDVAAGFSEISVMRLMATPDVIQDEALIQSTITNAKATVAARKRGGLGLLVWEFQPRENLRPERLSDIPNTTTESIGMAEASIEAGFVDIDAEVTFAFMQAIGMVNGHLVGSHRRSSSIIWP